MRTSMVLALAVVAVQVWPASTLAWDRLRNERGAPLFWRARVASLHPSRDASGTISDDVLTQAMADAAAGWNDIPCGDLSLEVLEPLASPQRDGDGISQVVIVRDAWPEAHARQLAFTTSHAYASGELIETDVLVNGVEYPFDGRSSPDLIDVLVHELGHVAGLGHSTSPSAAMFEDYREGVVLGVDDVEALCFIYPLGSATPGAPPPAPPACAAALTARASAEHMLVAFAAGVVWRAYARRGARRRVTASGPRR